MRALDERQLKAFDALTQVYSDNLIQPTSQVDRLWRHFLRRPKQQPPGDTEELRLNTYACFTKLGDRRRQIATRIARFFDLPESTDPTELKRSLQTEGPMECRPTPTELRPLVNDVN